MNTKFVKARLIQFLLFLVKLLEGNSKDALWQETARNGPYIAAIKQHREAYGSSLKEAKTAVDEYLHHYRGK